MPKPDLTPVTSSQISHLGHKDDTLYVRYKSGTTYAYKGVPAHLHQQIMAASSKGTALAKHIKGKFAHRKLPE